jgi:membrane associated rhomboid family serine protease
MTGWGFLRRPMRYHFYNATIILIAVNVVMFLLEMTRLPLGTLALIPSYVMARGAWWEIFTYMFLHANFWHILFNMLGLFLFGIQLEQKMGSTEFLFFYLVSGVGAGIATVFINFYSGIGGVPVIGASGAIYGVLLAFATFFPDARIFIFGILPMKAPTAVLVFAGIALFNQLFGTGGMVANLTHLAGLVFGYLYIVVRYGINPIRVFFRR